MFARANSVFSYYYFSFYTYFENNKPFIGIAEFVSIFRTINFLFYIFRVLFFSCLLFSDATYCDFFCFLVFSNFLLNVHWFKALFPSFMFVIFLLSHFLLISFVSTCFSFIFLLNTIRDYIKKWLIINWTRSFHQLNFFETFF